VCGTPRRALNEEKMKRKRIKIQANEYWFSCMNKEEDLQG